MIFWMKARFQHSFKYSKHLFSDTISHFIQLQTIFFSLFCSSKTLRIFSVGDNLKQSVLWFFQYCQWTEKNPLLAKLYLQVPCPVLILQSLSVFSSNCGCFRQSIRVCPSIKLILAWSLSMMGKALWFMTLKNLVLLLHYLKTNLRGIKKDILF